MNNYLPLIILALLNFPNTSLGHGLSPSHIEDLYKASKSGDIDLLHNLIQMGINVNVHDSRGIYPILYAASYNHMLIVSDLLKAGANPNAINSDGYAAIHFASSNRNYEMIIVLVDFGADLFLKSNSGDTALSIAIGTGDEDLVNFIRQAEQEIRNREGDVNYQRQTDINSHANIETEADGYQAITNKEKIFHAARLGDARELQQLINVDKIDPNVEDDGGWTPLTVATAVGHIEAMEVLLHHGAQINKAENDGWTPLMFAAHKGRPAVVETLLSHGADPSLASFHSQIKAHQLAHEMGHHEIYRSIVNYGVKWGIKQHNLTMTLSFIHDGGVVTGPLPSSHKFIFPMNSSQTNNEYDDETEWLFKETFLNASRMGRESTVRSLLELGAHPDIQDVSGWTGLLQAAAHGYTTIAKILLDYHAHVNHQENDGWTSLMFAAYNGHTEVVRLLLSYGADVALRSKYGQSAYQLAVAAHQDDVVAVLEEALQGPGIREELRNYVHEVDAGQDFGLVQDTDLDPAHREDSIDLLEAVRLGDGAAVAFNLAAGADINGADSRGFPPVSLAAAAGYVEILSTLLQHPDIDVNRLENDGWSPLMFAAYTGKIDSVELLLKAGANPYHRSRSGTNATEVAITHNYPEVVQLINNVGLKIAITEKSVPRIKQMLFAGADPNTANEKGLTALIVVLSKDVILEDVHHVLSYGADINRKENDGWSPLHFASFYGILPVVEILLQFGANCSASNHYGYLPEVYADSRGHSQVMTLLQQCRDIEKKREEEKQSQQQQQQQGKDIDEEVNDPLPVPPPIKIIPGDEQHVEIVDDNIASSHSNVSPPGNSDIDTNSVNTAGSNSGSNNSEFAETQTDSFEAKQPADDVNEIVEAVEAETQLDLSNSEIALHHSLEAVDVEVEQDKENYTPNSDSPSLIIGKEEEEIVIQEEEEGSGSENSEDNDDGHRLHVVVEEDVIAQRIPQDQLMDMNDKHRHDVNSDVTVKEDKEDTTSGTPPPNSHFDNHKVEDEDNEDDNEDNGILHQSPSTTTATTTGSTHTAETSSSNPTSDHELHQEHLEPKPQPQRGEPLQSPEQTGEDISVKRHQKRTEKASATSTSNNNEAAAAAARLEYARLAKERANLENAVRKPEVTKKPEQQSSRNNGGGIFGYFSKMFGGN